MIDLLVFEESLPRLTDALAHDDSLRVCWHADGRCSLGGRTVKPDAIKPEVGWISFDILAHGEMKHYVETLLQFDTLRWVQTGHAGLDNPLYTALAERGVRLSKSYAQSIAIAEYTLAHALHYRISSFDCRLSVRSNGKVEGLGNCSVAVG